MVDESAVARRILTHLVRASGGDEVIEAPSAEHALETVQGPLSIVITEWNLPAMSGLDLIAQLRQRPENAALRAMVVTTRGSREDVLQARKAGVDAYVLRPFTAETMKPKLDEMLRAPASEPAPGAKAA